MYSEWASSNSSRSSSSSCDIGGDTIDRGECMLKSSGSVCSGMDGLTFSTCWGIRITRRFSDFRWMLRFSSNSGVSSDMSSGTEYGGVVAPCPNSWAPNSIGGELHCRGWCRLVLLRSSDSSLASDRELADFMSDMAGLITGVGGLARPHL